MATETDLSLATETLSGDLRDWLLGRLRAMPKTWRELSEDRQRELAREAEDHARYLIRQAVELIAAQGMPVIRAQLGDVAVKGKGGIEAKVEVSRYDEHRHRLADAAGMPILITVADAAQFFGQRAEPRVDPDEPELPEAAD